ncbi:hypothetical protein RND81_02G126800 [Saponaria officinalis]|uniref:Uncharacterized protein n=1 Tax=Saponaria officinalis TaxID=3572 RepID=A0AAW1MXU2_SAPOF
MYEGCNLDIRCKVPHDFCTIISRFSIFGPMSPSIKAATSEAVGRLYVLPSVYLLEISLILTSPSIYADNLFLAILNVFARGFCSSIIFCNNCIRSSLNLCGLLELH